MYTRGSIPIIDSENFSAGGLISFQPKRRVSVSVISNSLTSC